MDRTLVLVTPIGRGGDTLNLYRDGNEAVVVRERGNGKAEYVTATLPWQTAARHLEVAA